MARKTSTPRARTASKAAAEDQRSRLRRMLAEALDQVDEEGLLFLLRQANVLIRNRMLEEADREQEELAASSPRRAAVSAARPRNAVTVDDDGSSAAVFLTLGTTRKVLDRDEVKRLVRICYSTGKKSEALTRLYTVLKRERSDIINDAGIAGPGSPLIEGVFSTLRARYHLDDR
jgi:hypothetical protein